MDGRKRVALTAHDALKPTLAAWAFANEDALLPHQLTATGNTGRTLMTETRLKLDCLRSGALGGDLELGALIAEGEIDLLILFTDPLTRKPHDIDPMPLWRIATLTQTALAGNEATADFIVRSELMARPYLRPHAPPALPAATQRLRAREDAG